MHFFQYVWLDEPIGLLDPFTTVDRYIIYRRVKKTKSVPRWIEIMAPVFSRAAWRCVWYMIQVGHLQ